MEIVELTKENISTYIDSCLELQRQLVSDPSSVSEELLLETAAESGSCFLAVIDNQKVAGFVVLSRLVHPVNVTGYVNNLVVDAKYRGHGLATQLMDALEKKAQEWGCTDLALTCSRETVWGMYEKRDYVQKDTRFYLKKI